MTQSLRLPWPPAALLTLILAPQAALTAAVAPGAWPNPGPECYWHNDSSSYSLPRWMSRISDGTRLDAISMVGTHDTGATQGGDVVATQSLSITAQLNLGVRALDLRFKHKGNGLQIHHGFVDQGLSGRDAVGQVVAFLKANPTETVLVRMKEEDHGSPNTNSFEDAFLEQVYNHFRTASPGIFWEGYGMPTLGQARGKIVILHAFPAGRAYGVPYSSADIQDEYTLKTNWDLYDKWLKVKGQLDKAAATGPGKRMFINYLSASGGSFPYFVVSGKSSSGTGAPRMTTGFTTPGWKDKYPDFPRVNCFAGICTIAFEGTNTLSAQHIRWLAKEREDVARKKGVPGTPTFVGILMTDFPGPQLMDAVTRLNTFER